MASWKKVIVSGSQAELCSLTVVGSGGCTQTITTASAETILYGNFCGPAQSAECISPVQNDSDVFYKVVFAESGSTNPVTPKIDTNFTYNPNTEVLSAPNIRSTTSLTAGGNLGLITGDTDKDVRIKTTGSFGGCISISSLENGGICLTPHGTGKVFIGGGNTIKGAGNGPLTLDSDTTITGDLTVDGDFTYLNVANLAVEDRFILLNSGSKTPRDGGLVVDEGAPSGSGHAFVYDKNETRWGFTASLNSNLGAGQGVSIDAFAAAVVTSDIAEYRKVGNIRIAGDDIYIYSGT